MECAIIGDGPAVIALHGAMGGFDQSLLLARVVGSAALRYVAVSRPGYLGTPLGAGWTPDEQADLYRDLLDALAIERATLMAISGGGPSALAFAARHPKRCTGLVIVSSVCAQNRVRLPLKWHVMKLAARFGPLMRAMRHRVARDPERAARRSIPDAAMRARTIAHPEIGPLLRALQLSTFERTAARLAGTENDIAITSADLQLPLEAITAPTLIVHGTSDRVAPFSHAQAMATRIPRAELLALEGGDHVAIFTHRDEVRPRVAAFLQSVAESVAESVAARSTC